MVIPHRILAPAPSEAPVDKLVSELWELVGRGEYSVVHQRAAEASTSSAAPGRTLDMKSIAAVAQALLDRKRAMRDFVAAQKIFSASFDGTV